jgi:cytochrome c oxidase subunit 4
MERAHPSRKALALTYLGLMFLLLLTALASSLPERWLSTSLSLGVAVLKAVLILAFFMQLYYRSLRVRVLATASLLWLFFLFGITLADYLTRGMIGVPGK